MGKIKLKELKYNGKNFEKEDSYIILFDKNKTLMLPECYKTYKDADVLETNIVDVYGCEGKVNFQALHVKVDCICSPFEMGDSPNIRYGEDDKSMINPTLVKEDRKSTFKEKVTEYCETHGIWNYAYVFKFHEVFIDANNKSYYACEFVADGDDYKLIEISENEYHLLFNDKKMAERTSVSQCLDLVNNKDYLEVEHAEPTIHFDKKVLESGLSFKEAYMRMVEGKKISRPCFMGWWFMNHESKVIIHDRYANELKEGDITNTVTNTLANDWEVIE